MIQPSLGRFRQQMVFLLGSTCSYVTKEAKKVGRTSIPRQQVYEKSVISREHRESAFDPFLREEEEVAKCPPN